LFRIGDPKTEPWKNIILEVNPDQCDVPLSQDFFYGYFSASNSPFLYSFFFLNSPTIHFIDFSSIVDHRRWSLCRVRLLKWISVSLFPVSQSGVCTPRGGRCGQHRHRSPVPHHSRVCCAFGWAIGWWLSMVISSLPFFAHKLEPLPLALF